MRNGSNRGARGEGDETRQTDVKLSKVMSLLKRKTLMLFYLDLVGAAAAIPVARNAITEHTKKN